MEAIEKITGWSAKRAGGRITIKGTDDTGAEIKLVGIDRIEGPTTADPRIIATDKNGERFQLA